MGDSLNVSFLKTTIGDLDQLIKDAARLDPDGDDNILEKDELCRSALRPGVMSALLDSDACSSTYETVRNYVGFRFVEEQIKETANVRPIDRRVYTDEERKELKHLLTNNYREEDVTKLIYSHGFPIVGQFKKDRLEKNLAVLVSRIFDVDDIGVLVSALSNKEGVAGPARKVLRSFVDLLPVKNDEFLEMLADPKVDKEIKNEIENVYRDWKNPQTFLPLFEIMRASRGDAITMLKALDAIATSSPENLKKTLESVVSQDVLLTKIEKRYKEAEEQLQLKHKAELEVAEAELHARTSTTKTWTEEEMEFLTSLKYEQKAEIKKLKKTRESEIEKATKTGMEALEWIVGMINSKDDVETRDILAKACIDFAEQGPKNLKQVLPFIMNIQSYHIYAYLKDVLADSEKKEVHHFCFTGLGRQYTLARKLGSYRKEKLEEMGEDILSTAKKGINTMMVDWHKYGGFIDENMTNLTMSMQNAVIGMLNEMCEDEYGYELIARTDDEPLMETLLTNQIGVSASGITEKMINATQNVKLPQKAAYILMLNLGKAGTPKAGELLEKLMSAEEIKLTMQDKIEQVRPLLADKAEKWEGRNVASEIAGYFNAAINPREPIEKRFGAIDRIGEVGGPDAQKALDKIAKYQEVNWDVFIGYALADFISFGKVAGGSIERIEGNALIPKALPATLKEIGNAFTHIEEKLISELDLLDVNRGNLASESDPDRPMLNVVKPAKRDINPNRMYVHESQSLNGRDLESRMLVDFHGILLTNDALRRKVVKNIHTKLIKEKSLDYCDINMDLGIIKGSVCDETGNCVGGCEVNHHEASSLSTEQIEDYLDELCKKTFAIKLADGGKYGLKYLEQALTTEKNSSMADVLAKCISHVSGDKMDSVDSLGRIIKKKDPSTFGPALSEMGELSKAQSETTAVTEESLFLMSKASYEYRSPVWDHILRIQDLLYYEVANAESGMEWTENAKATLDSINSRFSVQKNSEGGKDLPYHLMEVLQQIEAGPYKHKDELVTDAIGWFSEIEKGSCSNCDRLGAEVALIKKLLGIKALGENRVSPASRKLLIDAVAEMKAESSPEFLARLMDTGLDKETLAYVESKLLTAVARYSHGRRPNCSPPKNMNVDEMEEAFIVGGEKK